MTSPIGPESALSLGVVCVVVSMEIRVCSMGHLASEPWASDREFPRPIVYPPIACSPLRVAS
jgi:hypothetical protein